MPLELAVIQPNTLNNSFGCKATLEREEHWRTCYGEQYAITGRERNHHHGPFGAYLSINWSEAGETGSAISPPRTFFRQRRP